MKGRVFTQVVAVLLASLAFPVVAIAGPGSDKVPVGNNPAGSVLGCIRNIEFRCVIGWLIYGSGNVRVADEPVYVREDMREDGLSGNSSGGTDVVGGTGMATPGMETGAPLLAGLEVAEEYTQGRTVLWQCVATGGSGTFMYDFDFGDGNVVTGMSSDSTFHTYSSNGLYNAGCTVHDTSLLQQVTASTAFTLQQRNRALVLV